MKKVFINLIEQAAFNYPHPELEGWRFYRIEYGGHAERCYYEGSIWLPPHVDPTEFEEYLADIQEK